MLFDRNSVKSNFRQTGFPSHSLQIFRGVEGLKTIRPLWQELSAKIERKAFWHFYEWYEGYLTILEPNPQTVLFLLCVCENEPVAILPLKERQMLFGGMPVKVLELPRHPHMKFKDIVFPECYRTDQNVRVLVSGLRKNLQVDWDVIVFSDLLPDAAALTLLRTAPPPTGVEKAGSCCYIELAPSYEAFMRGLSKGLRKNLRTSNKRASTKGRLENCMTRDPPELDRALQIFLEIEASGWKGSMGARSAILLDPNLVKFYRHMVAGFGKMGTCEIDLLYFNDCPVAGTLGMIGGDTMYSLKIAYHEAYASISPGNLQREKIVQYHIAQGEVKYLNLMSGDSSQWQQRWRPSKSDTFKGFIFRRRPKSLMFFSLKIFKQLAGTFRACGFGFVFRQNRRNSCYFEGLKLRGF